MIIDNEVQGEGNMVEQMIFVEVEDAKAERDETSDLGTIILKLASIEMKSGLILCPPPLRIHMTPREAAKLYRALDEVLSQEEKEDPNKASTWYKEIQ